MSCYHDLPGLILFIKLLIVVNLFFLKLITVMLLVIHVNAPLLQFFNGYVVLDKPIAIVFQVHDIINGNVQKPDHDIKPFLVDFHNVVDPNYNHEQGVYDNESCENYYEACVDSFVVC